MDGSGNVISTSFKLLKRLSKLEIRKMLKDNRDHREISLLKLSEFKRIN